jgi:hypothetical protein
VESACLWRLPSSGLHSAHAFVKGTDVVATCGLVVHLTGADPLRGPPFWRSKLWDSPPGFNVVGDLLLCAWPLRLRLGCVCRVCGQPPVATTLATKPLTRVAHAEPGCCGRFGAPEIAARSAHTGPAARGTGLARMYRSALGRCFNAHGSHGHEIGRAITGWVPALYQSSSVLCSLW